MRADQLRLISWPFHNGLRNVSMGAGAARLATDPALRAGLVEEGWSVSDDATPPVDESDPEIARVIELIRLGTTAGIGSGFFDVMSLAMLTERGWRALRQTIPGHRPRSSWTRSKRP